MSSACDTEFHNWAVGNGEQPGGLSQRIRLCPYSSLS